MIEADDWKYKPILNTNTRTTYDGNQITQEMIEEYERDDYDSQEA